MIVQGLLLLLSITGLQGLQVAEDCSETEGAQLVNGICVCKEADHVISSDKSSCLPIVFDGYGSPCSDTSQCVARMSTGASCVDGSCMCVDNFHYLHGRCWRNRGYGEACSTDGSCYAYADSDTLVCSGGKCGCGNNTYSPHKQMCRRPAAEGEPCDFDLDCGMALCNTTSYTCDPVVVPTTTPGTTDENIEQLSELPVAMSAVSPSPGGVVLSRHTVVGDLKTCEGCDGPGKECTLGGKCVCAMGFFDPAGNGTCLPELGEPCISDSDCSHINMSVCRRSGSTGGRVCGCQGSWAPQGDNRGCVKTRKYNFNCQQDAQCSYYGGFCLNKKKCACPEGSHFIDQLCWPAVGLGDACTDPRDCSVPSGEGVNCTNNVCECSEGYRKTSTNDCWKIPKVLGDPCEDKSECDFTTDTSLVTCDDNTCSCISGYMAASTTTCVVGVGGPCLDDVDCSAVPTYKCVNGSCACPEGTTVGMFTGECLEEAAEYGGNCTEVTQCIHLLGEHAVCDEQGTCRCSQDYHYHERNCWPTKRLGEECLRASECYSDRLDDVDRLECRNSVCACKFDFLEDTETKICSSSSSGMSLSLAAMATCYVLLRLS